MLPAYVPGRTVPGAVKLASNETAYPLLPHVAERVAESLTTVNRYPDLAVTQLRQALADKLDVGFEQTVVGCGSVALCQQTVEAFAGPGDEVLFPWRSFEAYPIVSTVGGAKAVPVPICADQSIDLDVVAAAITERTKVIFICSPNNPTGTALQRAELTAFLDAVPADVLVVLDEAYREFVTDPDVPDGIKLLDRANLLVLRTFSKAYGLAGLRVGYGVAADTGVADALRKVQIPFSVNSIAQHAALVCLEPATEKELFKRVSEVVAERARVLVALRTAGFVVPPSQANFVWLPLADRSAEFAAHCESHGLIVRGFAGSGARITIGTTEENDLLLAAATSFPGLSHRAQ